MKSPRYDIMWWRWSVQSNSCARHDMTWHDMTWRCYSIPWVSLCLLFSSVLITTRGTASTQYTDISEHMTIWGLCISYHPLHLISLCYISLPFFSFLLMLLRHWVRPINVMRACYYLSNLLNCFYHSCHHVTSHNRRRGMKLWHWSTTSTAGTVGTMFQP